MQKFAFVLLCLTCAGVARRMQSQRSAAESTAKPSLEALASLVLGVNPTDAFSYNIGRGAALHTPSKRFVSRARTGMEVAEAEAPTCYTLLEEIGKPVDTTSLKKIDFSDPQEPSYVSVAQRCYQNGCPKDETELVVAELKKYLPDYEIQKVVTSLEALLKGEGYLPEENIARTVKLVAYGLWTAYDDIPEPNPNPVYLKAYKLIAKFMDSFGTDAPMEMEMIPTILDNIMNDAIMPKKSKNLEIALTDIAIDEIDKMVEWPARVNYEFPADMFDKLFPEESAITKDMLWKKGHKWLSDPEQAEEITKDLLPTKEEIVNEYRKKWIMLLAKTP